MSWRRSPLVAGCAAVLAVAAVLAALAFWNRRAIRAWVDPSYRDPTDLSAVERSLRARYGTSNLSVFWTTRTPPGMTGRQPVERRRRVGVHVVDSPSVSSSPDAVAAEIAAAVRASAGAATRVEVVLMNRRPDGSGWERRTFWLDAASP